MLAWSFGLHLSYTLHLTLQNQEALMVEINSFIFQQRLYLRKGRGLAVYCISGGVVPVCSSSNDECRFWHDFEGIVVLK